MKAEIKQESTLRPFSEVEMDGVRFRLGETFSCSVSNFIVSSNSSRSSPKESEGFYAGLKFSPESLQILEDSKEHQVQVHSTVPIPCFNSNLGHHCGVPLALSLQDPGSLGHRVSNVALSSCRLEIRPKTCGDGSCGGAAFVVTAVTDFTRDGNRLSLVSALPGPSAPRLWRSYVPTSLKVLVQDVPTSTCYSLTDPHVVTLDRRRYENHQTGTFVLYRSLVRTFEVHSRQWDCGSRRYSVACNCGVAAQEGNDVAIFDMCQGQLQETRPRLTLKTLGDRGSRVRVQESHQGRKVTLVFPSGAFVRADVSDWGMSLSVRAPSADYGNTRGLCGTFDRNSSNDLQGSDGGHYDPDDLDLFIEDWRIAPGESLFDQTPPEVLQEVRRPFCQCYRDYSTSQHHDRGTEDSDCSDYDHVDYTSVFPFMDTTVEHIKSPGEEERVLEPPAFSGRPLERRHLRIHGQNDQRGGSEEDLLLSVDRPKRQAPSEFRPVFATQSLTPDGLESLAYFFPEDHLAEARSIVQPQWPTPSGLTSAKALEVCQEALGNSSVGAACGRLLGRRLDEAVDLCMLDLQLKDDLGWEEALLPYLENECERQLLENWTQRAVEVPGSPGPSGEVLKALRCPNFCNGNGACTEWGCQCYHGYSFHDCSLAIGQPIEVTGLENTGLCDIRTSDCRSVRVFGLGFIDSPELSCRATRLKFLNGAWAPGEQQQTRATFLSSKALDCAVPSLSSAAVVTEDLVTGDRPYARWEIQVTNDGSRYSQAKAMTIYDGVCQICEASRSGLCKLKETTCNVEGTCLAAGSVNPSSPCLVCDPDASRFAWSVNRANQPPSFLRPRGRLRTFAQENFVFQLAASDPEGSALLFQLEEGPEGAALSPAGLLTWRVPPLDGEEARRSFRFTLSDECDARSSFTVEVGVAPCGCQNGGTCVTDVSFPPGSGRYLCVCPDGKQGERCGDDVDQCLSAPCAAGRCVVTERGYRCECPAGRRGLTCLEDVNECEKKPCPPGVQCFNSFGSYSCGPCPKGMLGNGTTCTAVFRPAAVTPHTALHKASDVLRAPGIKTFTGSSAQMEVQVKEEPPETAPKESVSWRTTSDPKLPVTAGVSQTVHQYRKHQRGDHLKNISGGTPVQLDQTKTRSEAGNPSIPTGNSRSAPGSAQSPALNVSASCSGRPCFPGVQCINRRPPQVGYVCGRCPPGLYGNGRVCTKTSKEASSLLHQQQKFGKTGPEESRTRASSPPRRHGTKRLSSSVARPDPPRPDPVSERAGGTGRREAVTSASTGVSWTTVSHVLSNSHAAHQRWRTTAVRASTPLRRTSTDGVAPPEQRVTPTHIKAWTPPRPAVPLTAALTSSSYTLPESDFSADGDESRPEDPEGPHLEPDPTPVTPQKMVYQPPPQRTTSGHQEASRHVATCSERPCFPGVRCEAAADGGLRCGRCPVGFTGDGLTCRAVCRHTCGRNMACAAPDTCRCKAGYTGADCQTATCDPECVNGGVCVAPGVCQCPRGFHGDACHKALCRSPCQNGGSCVGLETCSCPYGFVGPRCETMVCSRHCHNGGQCATPDECRCPSGWTGPSCETALCSPLCLNGGLCVRPGSCDCPPGFYGARCQNAVCSPPCKNGGVCMRNNICSCLHRYTGRRCEKSVCEPMCMNGGRCVSPDVCDCPSGWRGRRCDKPSCLQKCLNGGECVGPNTCHCAPGWQGMLCQIPLCDQKCLYGSRCIHPNVCACRSGFSGSECSKSLPITRGRRQGSPSS